MKHKYWMINLFGSHMIRAPSAEEALEVAKKHDIGRESVNKARKRNLPITRRGHEIDRSFIDAPKWFKDTIIQRRRQGLGGRIWCEDEKDNLMFESEEGDQYAKT